MPGIGSVFEKIGQVIGIVPKIPKVKQGAAPTPAKPGTKAPAAAAPGAKKPFDVKLYMKAVGLFFNDFFKKKLPYFFKNIGPVLKKFPGWWKKLPQDEQISYGVIVLGDLMLVIGVVLLVVL